MKSSVPNYILGISAFYHDSSAALIKDGEIIAAAQEERFSRIKFDPSYPKESIGFCLNSAGIKVQDLSDIVFFEDTHLKFDRILKTYFIYLSKSFVQFKNSIQLGFSEKLNLESHLAKHLNQNQFSQNNKFNWEVINLSFIQLSIKVRNFCLNH